ncbi:hypothetical protein KKE48_03770 [Patescibacteria group bacterium]|nr:hypothetical protein [Patescibacteria group bacterium]
MITNKMDPFQTGKKKKSGLKHQNFLEAFKDSGSTQTQPKTNQANTEAFNFEEFLNQQENKIRQQERSRFESIRREEQIIFSREKNQIKVQIETIQTQIKEMAKDQVGLMEEVDQAAFQVIVNPGVYHQNFFERLFHLIKLARKKVAESRTWLQLQNHRCQKRTGYWQSVKKSGTSFMLSGERTVSTQAG